MAEPLWDSVVRVYSVCSQQFSVSWLSLDLVYSGGSCAGICATAYAMPEDEGQISQALRLLATSDYLLARQFPVLKNLRLTSPHGVIEGAIPFDHYNDQQAHILEAAFVELEKDKLQFVGVGMSEQGPYGVPSDVSFPSTPFVITTFLEEDEQGRLTVLHAKSFWAD